MIPLLAAHSNAFVKRPPPKEPDGVYPLVKHRKHICVCGCENRSVDQSYTRWCSDSFEIGCDPSLPQTKCPLSDRGPVSLDMQDVESCAE
jgi:hypothetical protein